jgi:hypothetical protein
MWVEIPLLAILLSGQLPASELYGSYPRDDNPALPLADLDLLKSYAAIFDRQWDAVD